jgi:hypothetical protein
MTREDAIKVACCQAPDQLCAADECMAWLGERAGSTNGQCIWICTCFTLMKAMTPKNANPIITPR